MIVLDLPWPPSVNTYWRHPTRGPLAGRHLISQQGRAYRDAVAADVRRRSLEPITGRLAVTVDAHPPDARKRDLDNIGKALLDALAYAGVIRDDGDIDHYSVNWRASTGVCVAVSRGDGMMEQRAANGDDLLWNWVRWLWSGPTVGNMPVCIAENDEYRPVNAEHAQKVQALYDALPKHEQMAVTAEYPQKYARFRRFNDHGRNKRARAWIASVTSVRLTETEYKLYVGLFRDLVERTLV